MNKKPHENQNWSTYKNRNVTKKKTQADRKWFTLVSFIGGKNFAIRLCDLFEVCECVMVFVVGIFYCTLESSICYVCQWILSDFDGIEGYRSKTTKVHRNFTLYGLYAAVFTSFVLYASLKFSSVTEEKKQQWQRVKCFRHFCFMWYCLTLDGWHRTGKKRFQITQFQDLRPFKMNRAFTVLFFSISFSLCFIVNFINRETHGLTIR